MPPGRRPASTPSSPSAIARTAAPSVTIENKISDFSATARGVSAHLMPASISFAALSRERFQPTTLCPAAIRRRTISAPIAPSPINPTCICSLPELSRRDARAFGERRELRPYHVGIDRRLPDPGAVAAIAARHHVLSSHQLRIAADALRDQLGMLDEVRL